MAKKKDRHKSSPFQLRMHQVLRDQLEVLAERKLTNMTAEIIEAVRRHLESNGLWPPPPAPPATEKKADKKAK